MLTCGDTDTRSQAGELPFIEVQPAKATNRPLKDDRKGLDAAAGPGLAATVCVVELCGRVLC